MVIEMYLKPHQWIMVPHTAYEIRREMRVREPRQTAIAWDKRYFDCESGKFIRDKMPTIHSYSWNDLVVISEAEATTYSLYDFDERDTYHKPIFVPKDDDFDREIEEEKRVLALEKVRREQELERLKDEELERLKADEERKRLLLLEEERKYRDYVLKREQELRAERFKQMEGNNLVHYIRPNKWIVK